MTSLLTEVQRGSATYPGQPLLSIRGQLEPWAAHAQPSCLLSLGSSRLDDHKTELTSSQTSQKPLFPLLALLISKKYEGLGIGHIWEPDGTTVGDG